MSDKRLILIRGLPGSGKSTLAKCFNSSAHFEADMYHTLPCGKYDWKPENVKAAHQWCQDATRRALMDRGDAVVTVANTFVRRREIEPYEKIAEECGAMLMVVECHGEYGNIHGVPDDVLGKMGTNWEHYPPVKIEEKQ